MAMPRKYRVFVLGVGSRLTQNGWLMASSVSYYFKPVKVELKAGPLRPQSSKFGSLSEVKGQEPASLKYVYSAFSLKTLIRK